MEPVAIVAAVRTPFGKAGRAYAGVHAADLLGTALRGAVEAGGVDPERVEQVFAGCIQQGGDQSVNVARNGWLAAGLPITAAATTVDTQCGSSQQAVSIAAALIASRQAAVVVAGGVEAMSRVPIGSTMDVAGGTPYSPAQLARFDMPHQGEAGERMARKYGVGREESDAWGLRSHLLADEAWRAGRFKAGGDTTGERLAALPPVYREDGIITAGTASQLSDGASALLLASEAACQQYGLEPLAWVRRSMAVGVDPDLMMEGPIVATQRLLDVEEPSLDDIDVFEVHEAYATVLCAWHRQYPVDLEQVNVDGGAIGIGHPFGASGGRQLAHLVHTLRARGLRTGMQVMCCGGGIGTGTLIETTD